MGETPLMVEIAPVRRVTRRLVRAVVAATVVVVGLGYGVATAGPADTPGAPAAKSGCGGHASLTSV